MPDLDQQVEEARKAVIHAVLRHDAAASFGTGEDERAGAVRMADTFAALEAAIAARATAPYRALLMTLMDVATEAAGDRQTYDFKPRAESAAVKARLLLKEAP